MKQFIRMAVVGILALGLSLNASALLVTPASDSLVLWGDDNSASAIRAAIAESFECVPFEWYKIEVDDGSESGQYAPFYWTTFDNEPDDPEEATITWNGPERIDTSANAFLLVKDGNQSPNWYLFDLVEAGWDGMETLQLDNFWPRQGAISHVAIYGCANDNNVPDGGSSVLLLGAALFAVGGLKRFIR